jgi:hypothetical protein
MMSNEEFERKMAFIVNQQAKFEVDVEKLYEAQMLTEQKLQEANAVVTRLAYVTSEGFKDVNGKINALVNSQIATSEGFKHVNAKLNVLVNSQIATSEGFKDVNAKLNVLMNSQIATSEGFKDVNAKINALVNSQTALQDSQKQRTNSSGEQVNKPNEPKSHFVAYRKRSIITSVIAATAAD